MNSNTMSRQEKIPVYLRNAAGFHIWRQKGVVRMGFAHSHTDIEGVFLFEGKLSYFLGGKDVTVPVGQLALFWGGFPHQVLRADRVDGVWITLPLELWFAWKLPVTITESLFQGNFTVLSAKVFAPATLLRWQGDIHSGRPERKEAALLEIHAGILRVANAGTPLPTREMQIGSRSMEKALIWIHRHYREKITAEQVAAVAGIHPKHLMRMFRRQLGTTLWDYVTQQRLAHALRLLLSGDDTILSVALEAGFQSLPPFYQAFRKQIPGQTPAGFRKNYRMGNA